MHYASRPNHCANSGPIDERCTDTAALLNHFAPACVTRHLAAPGIERKMDEVRRRSYLSIPGPSIYRQPVPSRPRSQYPDSKTTEEHVQRMVHKSHRVIGSASPSVHHLGALNSLTTDKHTDELQRRKLNFSATTAGLARRRRPSIG